MKKNECANRLVCLFFSVAVAVLCVLFAGMEAKSIMHVYDLKPASASLISPELSRSTRTSAEELTGLRQVSVRLEADQRLRHRSGVETQVLIMLAVLLANTVFYKAKKRRQTVYYLLHPSSGWTETLKIIYHCLILLIAASVFIMSKALQWRAIIFHVNKRI